MSRSQSKLPRRTEDKPHTRIALIEVDAHINDPLFARRAAQALLELMKARMFAFQTPRPLIARSPCLRMVFSATLKESTLDDSGWCQAA